MRSAVKRYGTARPAGVSRVRHAEMWCRRSCSSSCANVDTSDGVPMVLRGRLVTGVSCSNCGQTTPLCCIHGSLEHCCSCERVICVTQLEPSRTFKQDAKARPKKQQLHRNVCVQWCQGLAGEQPAHHCCAKSSNSPLAELSQVTVNQAHGCKREQCRYL